MSLRRQCENMQLLCTHKSLSNYSDFMPISSCHPSFKIVAEEDTGRTWKGLSDVGEGARILLCLYREEKTIQYKPSVFGFASRKQLRVAQLPCLENLWWSTKCLMEGKINICVVADLPKCICLLLIRLLLFLQLV